MTQNPEGLEQLFVEARVGNASARGRLLDLYRNYLRLLAQTLLGRTLRLRLDPSDLVQETLLEAVRDFARFAGTSETELVAWLRRILVRNLADQSRRHRADRRDIRRQESLEDLLERTGKEAENALIAGLSTPSVRAMRREQAVLLADALAQLPDDYREVIVLRHLERLSFKEVAERLDRSPGAVRMLWLRALEKLHAIWEDRHDD
ncbi:MAG TPA: sigma-70 family RNA polymerase sigma factor [Gemmataceae bacterium]|nr:sigma-70 family RNA polymerase sigma factor [Gemmataceae bacterium]